MSRPRDARSLGRTYEGKASGADKIDGRGMDQVPKIRDILMERSHANMRYNGKRPSQPVYLVDRGDELLDLSSRGSILLSGRGSGRGNL